ncbi:hypothetical protein GOV04_05550 [Candidatus Woesearchaeota archaeon]|nr:hypothetical protein [Candidatus Woesearchaeota archaeon]
MKKEEIEEKLDKGYIQAVAVIELVGKPLAHVDETMAQILKAIKDDKDLHVIKQSTAKPTEQGELFSTYSEVELLAKNMEALVGFCFDYMPSSVEIVEPATFSFQAANATTLFTELVGKLHHVDMVAKQLNAQNSFLKRNMSILLRNSMLHVLGEARTEKEIMNILNLDDKELKGFLKVLVEQKLIKKTGKKYERVK